VYKRTLSRSVMILACAAVFTFVAAQYPWESDYSETSSSDESSPFGSPSDNSPYIEEYDSDDESGGGKSAPATAPAKQAKAKPERAKRERSGSAPAAFSGPQKTCPVCASVRLKGNLYVDGGGSRIHVCSAACIDRVRRNPSKFVEIMKKRGEQLATP